MNNFLIFISYSFFAKQILGYIANVANISCTFYFVFDTRRNDRETRAITSRFVV